MFYGIFGITSFTGAGLTQVEISNRPAMATAPTDYPFGELFFGLSSLRVYLESRSETTLEKLRDCTTGPFRKTERGSCSSQYAS
jgi:hypothetical protein